MAIHYTADTIKSPEGVDCAVLDVARVDFSNAATGRKAAETLVKEAKGGEVIITRNTKGEPEGDPYIAQKGDAIFVNLHNPDDVYVPGNADGSRWQFSELQQRGYEIVVNTPEGVRVKSAEFSRLLVEAVQKPTCIKDAWGAGQHQFLYPGATLKDNGGGRVTGIDKTAFDATWEVAKGARPAAPGL